MYAGESLDIPQLGHSVELPAFSGEKIPVSSKRLASIDAYIETLHDVAADATYAWSIRESLTTREPLFSEQLVSIRDLKQALQYITNNKQAAVHVKQAIEELEQTYDQYIAEFTDDSRREIMNQPGVIGVVEQSLFDPLVDVATVEGDGPGVYFAGLGASGEWYRAIDRGSLMIDKAALPSQLRAKRAWRLIHRYDELYRL